jgi:hypothetical protein
MLEGNGEDFQQLDLRDIGRPSDDLLKSLAAYIRGLDTQSRRRLLSSIARAGAQEEVGGRKGKRKAKPSGE